MTTDKAQKQACGEAMDAMCNPTFEPRISKEEAEAVLIKLGYIKARGEYDGK